MINLPKLLIYGLPVLVGLLLAGGGFLLFREQLPFMEPEPDEVTLTYWGVLEPREVMQPLIEEYEQKNPYVTIDYNLQSYTTFAQYKETLYTRLQQGAGPDIARMHATWPQQFSKYLVTAPNSVIDTATFSDSFYSSAVDACQINGQIYAMPLMYDSLVLLYNKDLFKDAAISAPPETWRDFRDTAIKLTNWRNNDPKEELLQSGAALGASSNISHAPDILGLMLAQSDISIPSQIDSQAGEDVFTFYTNFVNKDRVWNTTWPQDVSAFATGKVGMVLAPYWQYARLKSDSTNFDIGVAPVPQVPTLEEDLTEIGWANFWVDGVSANSEYPQEAWKFLNFLAEKQTQEKWMQTSRKLKGFTFASARKDLKTTLEGSDLAPVVRWASNSSSAVIASCAGNTDYERAVNSAVTDILTSGNISARLAALKETLTALVDSASLGLQEEPLGCALASFGAQMPGVDVEETPAPTSTPVVTPTSIPTEVPGPTEAPTLDCEKLEADTTAGSAPLEVTFTVTPADATGYQFDFGDGQEKETISERVVHVYEEADSYTASARVKDEEGNLSAQTDSCQVSISVEGAAETTPTAEPTLTPTPTPTDVDLDMGVTLPSLAFIGLGMIVVALALLY